MPSLNMPRTDGPFEHENAFEAWANATNSAQQFEKWYKDDKS